VAEALIDFCIAVTSSVGESFAFAGNSLFYALMYTIRSCSAAESALTSALALFGMWLPLGVACIFCDPSISSSRDEPHLRMRSPAKSNLQVTCRRRRLLFWPSGPQDPGQPGR
jgi:hypothetical protein